MFFRKTIIFQGFRGGPTFSGWSNIFQGGGGEGGANANFHRNLLKLGFSMQGVQCRGPDPLPPSGSARVLPSLVAWTQ